MDLAGFLSDIGDTPATVEPAQLRRQSRDFYWYSPRLKRDLDGVVADAVVTPRDEADVVRVAATCHRRNVPLTARGGGTGNYGQSMPLKGGVVLDMTAVDRLVRVEPGRCRVQAGMRLIDLDRALAPHGQEMRLHPSTRAHATVGGFVAGGSGGVGSITWGMLRERGNILGARLVTLEAEPRVLELRAPDIAKFNHSYGVTGVLTELELALAPAHDWIDAVVVFDDFMAAARFGQAFAEEPALVKKQCAVLAAPIAHAYLKPLRGVVAEHESCALVMVAGSAWEPFVQFTAEAGGRIVQSRTQDEVAVARGVPLYELCWNHTTLWALRRDPSFTYLQTAFPAGTNLELVETLAAHFGDEVLMHLEFMRSGKSFTCSALQLVRYTTEERLNEIMAFHEARGCRQFNPHAYTLEEGGMKQVDHVQLAFKREADPKGLLNPGKMLAWEDAAWSGASAPASHPPPSTLLKGAA